MNKHTELPWALRQRDGIVTSAIESGIGIDKFPYTIVIPSPPFAFGATGVLVGNKENAAFIVKACNNHYQLLEALKEVTEELHQLCGDEVDDPSVGIVGWDFINEQIIPNAREAIKQAEEGEGEDDE